MKPLIQRHFSSFQCFKVMIIITVQYWKIYLYHVQTIISSIMQENFVIGIFSYYTIKNKINVSTVFTNTLFILIKLVQTMSI